MKPKVYRKTKPSNGSKMADYKINEGGGTVEGIIKGPESSIGSNGENCAHPMCEQGKEKGMMSE